MDIVAKQYVRDAEQILMNPTYLEYFSYFKSIKQKHVAQLYEKAGNLFELTDNSLEDAGDNYMLAATYYIEVNLVMLSAINHQRAGKCFQKAKNYTKSSVAYRMALEQQPFDTNFVIKCSSSIAENYFALGNIAECIKWFESCIYANVKIGRDDLNFDFYDKLGIIYCTYLKRYAIGITVYDKLVELLRKRDDVSLQIYCFISVLLRILANDDDMEFAKKYMDSLDKSFLESGYAEFLRNIFFYAGKDVAVLERLYTYYGERVPGLDNVNVKELVRAVIAL
jgi:tetratricopeptide (TPR) repeat protein